MSIFVNQQTRVIVQGITGREGAFHTERMINTGTNIVAGVTPGKGGEWAYSRPIFDTVKNAVNATDANTSVIFVPPTDAADAIYEAIDAGIRLIICITEGIPLLDTVRVREYIRLTPSRLLGPNCPGILAPGIANIGIIPDDIATPGNIGVVSKSGTLAYEVVQRITNAGMGQSTIIGIGGDPVNGTNFVDVLRMFEDDLHTEKIVMIGEIGGHAEIEAARYITQHMTKPVVAYIVGRQAPIGERMGHEGAIVDFHNTDAESKINSLRDAGVRVADYLDDIPDLLIGQDL